MNPGLPAIDLIVEKNGKRIAIEIETGKNEKEQILQNVMKCLNAGYEIVFSIGTNEKAFEKIKESVPKDILERYPGVLLIQGRELIKWK